MLCPARCFRSALLTACANDFGYDASFARQIEMQAQPGDVLICISSSGNSANILAALHKASSMGLKTIALTGFGGGESVLNGWNYSAES